MKRVGECKKCGRCCRVSISLVPEDTYTGELGELLRAKGSQYIDNIENGTIRRYARAAYCPHYDLILDICRIYPKRLAMCKRGPETPADLLPGCGYAFVEDAQGKEEDSKAEADSDD